VEVTSSSDSIPSPFVSTPLRTATPPAAQWAPAGSGSIRTSEPDIPSPIGALDPSGHTRVRAPAASVTMVQDPPDD